MLCMQLCSKQRITGGGRTSCGRRRGTCASRCAWHCRSSASSGFTGAGWPRLMVSSFAVVSSLDSSATCGRRPDHSSKHWAADGWWWRMRGTETDLSCLCLLVGS